MKKYNLTALVAFSFIASATQGFAMEDAFDGTPGAPVTQAVVAASSEVTRFDSSVYFEKLNACNSSDEKADIVQKLFHNVIANRSLPAQDRAEGVELALGMGFKSLLATDLLKPTLNQLNTFMMKAETLGTTSHWLNQILEAGLVTDPKTKALMQKLSARMHQKTHLKVKDQVIKRDGNAEVMFGDQYKAIFQGLDVFKDIRDSAATRIGREMIGKLPLRNQQRTPRIIEALLSATTTEDFYKFFIGERKATGGFTNRFVAFSDRDKKTVLDKLFGKIIGNPSLPAQERAEAVNLGLGFGLTNAQFVRDTLTQLQTFVGGADLKTLKNISGWLTRYAASDLVSSNADLVQSVLVDLHREAYSKLRIKYPKLGEDGLAIEFEGRFGEGSLALVVSAPVTVATVEPIAAFAPVEDGDAASVVTTVSEATLGSLPTAPSSVSTFPAPLVVRNAEQDDSWVSAQTVEDEEAASASLVEGVADLTKATRATGAAETEEARKLREAEIRAGKAARVDGVVPEGTVASIASMFDGKKK